MNLLMNTFGFESSMAMALSFRLPAYTQNARRGANNIVARGGRKLHTQQCVCLVMGMRVNHLTRNDYATALRLLAGLEANYADSPEHLAQGAVMALSEFVAAEVTTLSVCDSNIDEGQAIDLSDAWSTSTSSGDGCPGPEHMLTVPLFSDGRRLVSVVLKRRGLDFSPRDVARIELIRPHLAFLYRQACRAAGSTFKVATKKAPMPAQPDAMPTVLTQREAEVMRWLSCGKTDADIAALLSISPRTVNKHLEHIYQKLGVETRTAAVMRAHSR
jgi:DNA-binding CsgD family transcriptional regulator